MEKTAEEVSSSTGNPVLAVQCDVRDPEAVKNAVDKCEQQLGKKGIVFVIYD